MEPKHMRSMASSSKNCGFQVAHGGASRVGSSSDTIDPPAVAKKGSRMEAAQVLAKRFSDDPPPETELTWDSHCWVRLRATMSLLEEQIERITTAHGGKDGKTRYADLAKAPPPFQFSNPPVALGMLQELLALAGSWASHPAELSRLAPKPPAELLIMPRV